MSIETDQFVINEVEWNYDQSHQITGKPWIRGQSVLKGIGAVKVTCKKCSHVWRATEGNDPRQFQLTMGAMQVSCPICEAEGPVPIAEL
jgi:hypothetical protein